MIKRILLYILTFTNVYSHNFDLKVFSKINNYTDIGIGGYRELRVDLINVDLKISNKRASIRLITDVNYEEPNVNPENSRFSFNLDPYVDFDFSLVKLGVGSYKDDTYYRKEIRDYVLVAREGIESINTFFFVKPNYSFKIDDTNIKISSLTGLQKEKANELNMIVYKINLSATTTFNYLISNFSISLGKSERFETIRPFAIDDPLSFLDGLRISSSLESKDFFNIKFSQEIPFTKGTNIIKIVAKEEVYYSRDKEINHRCSIVGSLGIKSLNKISSNIFSNYSFRFDFVHFMHLQENRIWFVFDLDLGFFFNLIKD